jgi:hypothetical protein
MVLLSACAPSVAPELTAIEPATVSSTVATRATLRGRNLGPAASLSLDNGNTVGLDDDWSVRIGATAARNVTVVTPEQLSLLIPARLRAGVYDVTATSPRGEVAELRQSLTVQGGAGVCETPCTQGCDMSGCCTATCGASPCSATCMCATCNIDCNGQNECRPTCGGTRTCEINCDGVNNCVSSCTAGATCRQTCDKTNNCALTCDASTCEVECGAGNNCDETRCVNGAKCVLRCQSAANCKFAECSGALVNCPGKVVACNRPCP